MERPTLRQLEILAEVARIGTFRGAARHLGLSQVAVSDHIRQLESRLGCALFVRNAGGKPSLSPSGRIVLDHGRNVLFACDALISAARGAAEGGEGVSLAPPVSESEAPVLLDYADDLEPVGAASAPEDEAADYDEEGENERLVAALRLLSPMPISAPAAIVAAAPAPARTPPARIPDAVAVPDAPTPVTITLRDVMKDLPVEEELPAPPAPEVIPPPVQAAPPPPAAEPVAIPVPEPDPQPVSVNEKPITVASHPAILSRFQDKLAAAQEAFPDRPIAVDFARFTPDAVVAALTSGRIDIALFYALGEVRGLSSDYLWSESWSLFARADHPLAQMDELHLADCVDMPVILFEEANPLRALCEACLVKAGLWPAPTVLETDDFAAIATELLEYGEAVFPAFGVTAAQFAARQGLKRLALVEPLPSVQIRRATAPSVEEDPTVAALAGLLG